MTRRSLLVLLAALLLPPPAAVATPPDERLHVVVLHTNDVHGQVVPRLATWLKDVDPLPDSGGLPRLAAAVVRARRAAEAAGALVLTLDAGDWFQGTPEGRIGRGRPFLAALTAVGYDAMAVGNHDFDHGVEVLVAHLRAAEPPALLANATLANGESLPGTRPYRIVERGDLRVALVGLCSVHTPTMTHASARALVWREPAEVLTRLRRELDGAVDLVIPLTHLGVGEDRVLARAHPDLPLIVGGHSHSLLRGGLREGATLIVQAGAQASLVGRVDLWLDRETRAVLAARSSLIELYQQPPRDARVPAVEAACADLRGRSEARMGQVVGALAAGLPRGFDAFSTSPCGNLVTDAMRTRTGADVALHNRGGLRTDLAAGEVTRRHLFQLLPFDNHLVTLTLSGAELEALMRRSVESRGGRGLEFSGMALELDRRAGTPKLARVLVQDRPLDPARDYRVTVNSFNAEGGDGYQALADATRRQVDPILLRDVVAEYLDGKEVTPPRGSRFRD